jgi:hypothetical protein
MPQAVEFYFDFSSPYGYFAAAKIDALAARHGRSTIWRPILLGAVFKITGQQPLTTIPLKGSYAVHDLKRSARWFELPFRMPSQSRFQARHRTGHFTGCTTGIPMQQKRSPKPFTALISSKTATSPILKSPPTLRPNWDTTRMSSRRQSMTPPSRNG